VSHWKNAVRNQRHGTRSIPERLCPAEIIASSRADAILTTYAVQRMASSGPSVVLVSSQSGCYFDVLKRQALATSFTPSNVPSQLMYQFSFSSSSELGLLLAWVPYIHLVSLL